MKRITAVRFAVSVGLVLVLSGLSYPSSEASAGDKAGSWSSGWESEKALVKIKGGKWTMQYEAYPSIAYNLRGDGKWVLISNRDVNSRFFGYFWDKSTSRWVEDKSLVAGLKARGWHEHPALARDVMGDKKWTLITRAGGFHGYYWDGAKWVEDEKRANGLPKIRGRGTHTFIRDLKGDGRWTLIAGAPGGFRAFCWDGAKWTEDTSRVNGLGSKGGLSRAAVGFNVFGEQKWNLIACGAYSTSLKVFSWRRTQWIEEKGKSAGLKTSLSSLVPTLGHNLRGDGKWVLISGVAKYNSLLGFVLNKADTTALPAHKDITSYHPLATTVRIKFAYPHTWNHRVRYSTRDDMTDAVWSKWFEDLADVDIKLEGLSPGRTYYYRIYTYVPWDTSHYVTSPRRSFTTIAGRSRISVKPGESIQDAIETLPSEGGIIELAEGVHNVRKTIVIGRSNVTIQGTHKSEINTHVRRTFVIPHENPSPKAPWPSMPVLENFVFKGFKVVGHKSRGLLILAWNVKNITVEDILLDSGWLVAINPTGGSTSAHSENIVVRNNTCPRSGIAFCFSKNVRVTGNTSSTIDINRNNDRVYIKNNTVSGGSNYNIRGHGGNHVLIDNNVLLGRTQVCVWIDGLSNVTMSNNVMTGATIAAIHIEPQGPRRNVKIVNNRICGNKGSGILTTRYSYGFSKKMSDVTAVNNTICDNGGDGIRMTTEWVKVNAKNNIITNNRGWGINYVKTNEPSVMGCNDLWNNGKGNYNNTAPGEGDISSDPLFADPGNADFHLKSKAGRWDPKIKKWVKDKVQSPCIDAGDPASDCSGEPAPNGGRINMGAYGNTKEASKAGEK